MASNVHLSIDPTLRTALEKESRKRGISINALVKVVLWGWLKNGKSSAKAA